MNHMLVIEINFFYYIIVMLLSFVSSIIVEIFLT